MLRGSQARMGAGFAVLVASLVLTIAVCHAQEPNRHIDWREGAIQETAAGCGAFQFTNMDDKTASTLIVRGSGGSCSFAQEGLTFHFAPGPNNVPSKANIYTFLRSGTDVFVNHVGGF
jgi:hypothetical protein